MYGQRRGLAQAQTFSDDQARNTNLTMMQRKRKQQLEEQLENKRDLLKQYTNPRGIGMRGQTVNPRDVEILEDQIRQIQVQLEQITNPGGAMPPGSSAGSQQGTPAPTPRQDQHPAGTQQQTGGGHVNQWVQQQAQQQQAPPPQQQQVGGFSNNQPSQQYQQPVNPSGVPFKPPHSAGAGSRFSAASTGARSKRDEVYERKRQAWLERTSTRGAGSVAGSTLTSLNNAAPNPFNRQQAAAAGNSFSSGMSSASGRTGMTERSQLTTSTNVAGAQRDQPANQWGGQHQRQQPQVQQYQQQQQNQAIADPRQHQQFSQVPQQSNQQQPQQEVRYGRRATPTQGHRPPMNPTHQQQQQGGGIFGGAQQQPQQPVAGRRASASGTRPW